MSVDKTTYAYDFHYRQSFLGYADWVNGSHVDDLYSLFGEPFLESIREVLISVATFHVINFFSTKYSYIKPFFGFQTIHRKNFSDTDRSVSLNVIHYFSNFAYTG